eukprot:scaffold13136_cov30-Tisochrysis_lutea.AAC.4
MGLSSSHPPPPHTQIKSQRFNHCLHRKLGVAGWVNCRDGRSSKCLKSASRTNAETMARPATCASRFPPIVREQTPSPYV